MLLMVILPIGGISVTVDDLKHIVKKHGEHDKLFFIDGCKLLEYIEDVEWFISFLGKFDGERNFLDDYPDPITAILNGDFNFRLYDRDCGGTFWICVREGMKYYSAEL